MCDFRLGYGKVLSRKSKVVAINRSRDQLYKVHLTYTLIYMNRLIVSDAARLFLKTKTKTFVSSRLKGKGKGRQFVWHIVASTRTPLMLFRH